MRERAVGLAGAEVGRFAGEVIVHPENGRALVAGGAARREAIIDRARMQERRALVPAHLGRGSKLLERVESDGDPVRLMAGRAAEFL